MAAAPLGSQRRALHEEYAAVRDQLLAHLLRQAAALYEQGEHSEWRVGIESGCCTEVAD